MLNVVRFPTRATANDEFVPVCSLLYLWVEKSADSSSQTQGVRVHQCEHGDDAQHEEDHHFVSL